MSGGCGEETPVGSASDTVKDGEHAASQKEARLKAYGTAGQPKSEKAARKN